MELPIPVTLIATPVSTHYELAMQALKAGKHVLIEKPLAATTEQGRRIIEEAERRNLVAMVDHTFVYTGAVRKIRELIAKKELGDIYYYDSVRVNLGMFQHDVNVLWDLAVHDLSILSYVLPDAPCAVSATGISHVPGRPENIGYISLFFPTNLIAHLHVNWLSPVKLRRTLIGGSRKMILYDDVEPSEKIKVYDKGIALNNGGPDSMHKILVSYRVGDMSAPQLDITEALRIEAEHFRACIEDQAQPITPATQGLPIIEILEAATRSMAERGRVIELSGAHAPVPAVAGAAAR